ncbi:MAG: hypothetical protein IPP07_05950 [Holophagales bacterium]|nr:hypothetical protein [Holophagales bacterium]MBK9964453.1 hypothetical protein [Holophagales bacterium]
MPSVHIDPTPQPASASSDEEHPAPDPTDEDDGIHVAYVTRVDRPFGPLLLVVVSWFELGEWVERTYELSDEPRVL